MLLRKYYLSVVFFLSFDFCKGQQVIPKYPNCCEFSNQTYNGTDCSYSDTVEQTYRHIYYDSNKTHINDHPTNFTLNFYHKSISPCDSQIASSEDDIIGFIFNGSVINKEYAQVYNSSQYCISKPNNIFYVFICETPDPDPTISRGQVYFPCVIISTLCYLCSAIIYKFVLDVKEVYQKCFIGYCSSMTVTFLFLILLQKINTDCQLLGSIFFLFILSSFVWLFCLCFEVMYSVWTVMRENNEHSGWIRYYFYISGSTLIPAIISIISIFPSGSPDVPNEFMKTNGMCNFKGSRPIVLFVPIGILLLLALGSLIYAFYLIRLDDKKYPQNIIWLEKKSSLNYKTRSCFMIWLPSFVWILDVMLVKIMNKGNFIVYEIIEGLQGIFVIAVFVSNRYTRKNIYNALCVGKTQKRIVSNSTRFRRIIQKFETKSINSELGEEVNELPAP